MSNIRVQAEGPVAKLRALVDATHIAKSDPSRHFAMMNWYYLDLVRDAQLWRTVHLVIDNVWFTGNPVILLDRV